MNDLTSQFLVYQIANKINGKLYIGVTTQGIIVRWKQHIYDAKSGNRNCALHNAIRRYGEENFTIDVLKVCACHADMLEAEEQLVELYSTIVPHGYNMAPGGRAGRGQRGPMPASRKKAISDAWRARTSSAQKEFSEKMRLVANERSASSEYREKLRKANTGKRVSEEAKEKIRAARAKQVFSAESIEKRAKKLRGYVHSEKAVANMSAAQKGRIVTNESAIKISKKLRFLSDSEAAIIKFNAWGWDGKSYAEHFGTTRSCVCDIQKGRTYKDITELHLP